MFRVSTVMLASFALAALGVAGLDYFDSLELPG